MPFSAGTVVLDIWPSLRGVQNAIRKEAQGLGVIYEREMTDANKRVTKSAAVEGDRRGAAFANALRQQLERALKATKIDADIELDDGTARARLAAFAREASDILDDLEAHIDIDAGGTLAELRALEREAEAILGDVTMDVEVRSNAGQARLELVRLREQIEAMQGLTQAEERARIAAARAEAKAQADALRAREQDARERLAITTRTRAAEEKAAREIVALEKRLNADRTRDVKRSNDDIVTDYRRVASLRSQLLAAARQEERESVATAGRTGLPGDEAAAVAAIRARYEAEARAARSAAEARAAAALRAAATEEIAAEAVQRAVAHSYDEQADAARRASAERAAIARLTASVERVNSSGMSFFDRFRLSQVGQAANSMRLFNGYLLTAVTLGPLLIPILASLAAGFGAIAVAATAAIMSIGVIIAGFGGIGTALQALSAVDKERRKQSVGSGAGNADVDARGLRDAQERLARAREDYGQRIAEAAQRQADAERRLGEARQSAADAIVRADQRQADAERTLTRAVQDASDAQNDLIEARQSAARQLEDMNNQLASGLLDEQLGAYRMQEAAYRLNTVLEDDQATAREKQIAQLTYDQEVQQYKELQTQNRRLEQDVAAANAKGVEGSEAVIDAKDRIVEANQSVIDAEQDVRDAQAESAAARVDAAQTVADAERDLADAVEARRRAQVDEDRSLADAERAVADALVDLRAKSVEAGVAGSAAMDQLREAMDQLSPAGQRFATFLYGLKPFIDAIREAAQSGILPALEGFISALIGEYGDDIIKLVGALAGVMGELISVAAEQITNPWWQDFFAEMANVAPELLRLMGEITGELLTGFVGVLKAFLPYADDLLGFILDLAEGFADWGTGLSDSKGFAGFMEYIQETAPRIVDLIELILEVFVKLAIGLAPYADQILGALTSAFGWLADQSPEDLGRWTAGILVIVGAIQSLAGAFAALFGAFGLFGGVGGIFKALGGLFTGAGIAGGTAAAGGAAGGLEAAAGGTAAAGAATAITPVGWALLIVAALLAIAGAIVVLYNTSEGFRDFWDGVWNGAGAIVSSVGEWIRNAVREVGDTVEWVWENLIGPPIMWVWTNIISPVAGFIVGAFNIIGQALGVLGNITYQVIHLVIATAWNWLNDEVIQPVTGAIAAAWNWLNDEVFQPVWENGIKPVLEALGNFITNNVAPAFQTGMDTIATIWGTLVDIAKIPVAFVVNTVINGGIIDTFNRLTDVFPGLKKVDHVQLPPGWDTQVNIPGRPQFSGGNGVGGQFARGGVVPGYTPGRDVHHFVSPTGGRLDLSGGEGILVPELVRQLGADWVYENNRRARAGRPLAYADGGILGWLGNGWDAATDVIEGAVGSTLDLLRDPAGFIRGLVSDLIGTNNSGIAGIAAGAVSAIVDAVAGFFGTAASNETGTPAPSARAGMGWSAMESIIAAAFPSLRITSAFRPGARTASGGVSMHALGRAIDIAPPSMRLFNWLAFNYPDSAQILYTPAGARQLVWNNQMGNTSGITAAQHYNHVHWAMADGGVLPLLYDNGGALPPGLSLVVNRTDKPEQVLTAEQFDRVTAGGGGVSYTFDVENMGYDPRDVARELEKMRRDRLAVSGLSEIGVSIG